MDLDCDSANSNYKFVNTFQPLKGQAQMLVGTNDEEEDDGVLGKGG